MQEDWTYWFQNKKIFQTRERTGIVISLALIAVEVQGGLCWIWPCQCCSTSWLFTDFHCRIRMIGSLANSLWRQWESKLAMYPGKTCLDLCIFQVMPWRRLIQIVYTVRAVKRSTAFVSPESISFLQGFAPLALALRCKPVLALIAMGLFQPASYNDETLWLVLASAGDRNTWWEEEKRRRFFSCGSMPA